MEMYANITLPNGSEYTTKTVDVDQKKGVEDWERLMEFATNGKLNYVTVELHTGHKLVVSGETFKNSIIEVCNV